MGMCVAVHTSEATCLRHFSLKMFDSYFGYLLYNDKGFILLGYLSEEFSFSP